MTTTEDRLYSRLYQSDSGCWEYHGARDSAGYGRIWHINNTIMAHRASWIVHHGDIPAGLFVLHKCDNPPCCHPDHLFIGTATDNTKDMMNKGRRPDIRICKLTAIQVLEIKNLLTSGMSRRELKDMFNVSFGAIDAIKHGRNWEHIK